MIATGAAVIVLVAIYVLYVLLRPLSPPKTILLPPVIPAQVQVNIPWPADGQAAFGATDYGLLAIHNQQTPTPTASIAKVIAALVVLDKKPLSTGQQGPAITMTAADVALYQNYVANDGSVVPVSTGQVISEYQALQAMMLPSANNISDTVAIWAYGSLAAYRTAANEYVKKLGMTQTTVGSDASGFSPSTVSTARDLVLLGQKAMTHPVLSEIVGQRQAEFPGVGTIYNVDTLLGNSGVRGIKTGNTDEAGGCFLGAADITVAGKKITVITAIMASSTRGQALRDTLPLVQSAVSQFQNVHVLNAGQVVGRVTTEWGSRTDVIAKDNVDTIAWSGTALSPKADLGSIKAPATAGTTVGKLQLDYAGTSYSSTFYTKDTLTQPTLQWRLTHPL